MRSRVLLVVAVILALAMVYRVQGAVDEIKSGPQPGAALKPALIPGSFQAWMVSGDRAGRFHSPVCAFGLNPVMLVFVQDTDEKPLVALLKKIDEMAAKHPDARLGCCVILLNDGGFREALEKDYKEGEDFSKVLVDAAKLKDDLETKLKELAQVEELKRVVFALDTPAGPKEYKINPEAQVTVLFYNKHVILNSFAYPKEKFTDLEADKIAQEVHKTVLEVERLSRPQRR